MRSLAGGRLRRFGSATSTLLCAIAPDVILTTGGISMGPVS
jgi:hypothetical protein